ncbi:similar to Saccharomyces cerevisiae YJR006W POL31 DNA polymerase III (delta) subunit, essential for cell viability [Maudiozyma barnettii]|uniref:Similar to Saccharomyces cerevisiae YJR006W POL31 DNA polymerase III (Delta) subunit, essential for cell viability n=1 Tax=Maudiozyma barnettii TaxID=61262 RepID=A0A8H2ZG39_9SACH|nr:DNA-directed DNA polymerase delta subunit POL31 [Kazachstania barnettii]CAB4252395.1 similar to Saccharomyces cerevisiae YJR006W POL31 DNA polymerase III (delta) subunit, essential for cell viability [Kazachstania barnettii]CAD1779130.1 similar to Saccharomyces cerevisiae YJR006W POL31 DNA polymerase III (delta) subunit, essential for cell viability [Kazachstania barnettii]
MDSLLQKFNETRPDDPAAVARKTVKENINSNNRFKLPYDARDYTPQFYHMYQNRLNILRERVQIECEKKWDNGFQLNGKTVVKKERVLDIQGEEPCWCVGTIYCEMKYKPNILQDVISDTFGAPDLVKSYTDPDGSDEIMLEDESGRVLLVGDFIGTTPLISGTVVGLLGMEAEAGTFQVLDICYPTAIPQKSLPAQTAQYDEYIAFVSGFNINATNPTRNLKLKLLQEYLMGDLSSDDRISKIGKLIICGNLVEFNAHEKNIGEVLKSLEDMGDFLANTLQTISVDIMPGATDPSDKTLPQQPLNKALFKESLRPYFDHVNDEILNLVTNPYNFQINDVEILTTSGQNIDDIIKYIVPYQEKSSQETEDKEVSMDSQEYPEDSIEHRLDLMECTMKWQNIIPTAPDTLGCYPYTKEDPFILEEWPHLYVVSNQPSYARRDIELDDGKTTVKMFTVPEFSQTGQIVLLNLKDLSTDVVNIQL